MYYEKKEIPLGSGNFYWYRRALVEGRQKSVYVGKQPPLDLLARDEEKHLKNKSDCEKYHQRLALQEKIRQLTAQLSQLK